MKTSLKGLTLTELLVSSIMIGIVMVGVGGFTATVKQMQETSYRGSHVSIELESIIGFMKKDILLAVGENTNKGVLDNSTAGAKILCLRHNQNNITSYIDDRWRCWHANLANSKLHYCQNLNTPVTNCPSLAGAEEKITLSNPGSFFMINQDVNGRLQSVTMTLTARHNPTKIADEYKNPNTTVTLEVAPVLHTQ